MKSLGPIEVHPLALERMDDYLHFFDGKAFGDNPRWAGCYCFFPYHDPARTHWPERLGEENRTAICASIRAGTAMGYLAYVDGEVIGWCNAAPRRLFPMLQDEPAPDDAHMGTIFCFIVAPAFRRKGVATALLDAACAGLTAQGLRIVEARPVRKASTAAANHLGPLAMYLAAGFSIVREDDDGNVHVRKRLEP
ncbi:MAG TPA: GNAT family N-acetyltransferase [Burkholderiaceae bacterium]|nr:GNAT family N-acetyltransferase [Burkholderiaceae bacterium]